jgi:hypothetical protein
METKERLTKAINRLIKADANFIENLEKLADLAEKNKFIYNQAVNKLKSL